MWHPSTLQNAPNLWTSEEFISRCLSPPVPHPELTSRLCKSSYCPTDTSTEDLVRQDKASFLEILAPPLSMPYHEESDFSFTAHFQTVYPSGSVDGTCRNSHSTDVRRVDPTYPTFGQEESQSVTSHYNAVATDNEISSEASNLRAQAHVSLDPEWTLGLDTFPAISTTTSDVIMHEDFDSGQWSQQEFSHSLGNFFSTNADTQPITISSFPATTTSSQDNTQVGVVDKCYPKSTYNAFETQPESCPSHAAITKKPSKRKRISSIFSRKKQHLDPGQTSQDKTTETLDPQPGIEDTAGSLLGVTSSPTAPAPLTERLSNGPISRMSKPDWAPDNWENRNGAGSRYYGLDEAAVLVGDVQVASSDRRPMSYPPRNAFRKSLDISVAVLTKGFERLRGDCAVSPSS